MHILKKNIPLTFIILFISIFLHAQNSKDVFLFTISPNSFLNYQQKRSISGINSALSKYLLVNKPIDYTIITKEQRVAKKNRHAFSINNTSILFSKSPDILSKNKNIFSDFTINVISKALKIDQTKLNDKNLQWLLAGIYKNYQRYIATDKIPLRASFPITHYLMMSGEKISIKNFFSSGLCDSYSIGKELYIEESEIFLNTMAHLKNGKLIINELIKYSAANPINTSLFPRFISLLKKYTKYKSAKSFNSLLNKSAFYYSVNLFMPASTNYCKAEMKKMETVVYKEKDSFIVKKCKLTEIASKLKKMENPKIILKKKISFLKKIKNSFPYFLISPTNNLIETLSELKNNAHDLNQKTENEFNNRISKCIKSFHANAEKQDKLNKLLEKTEIETIPINKQVDIYSKIIETHKIKEKAFWPELNKYMDQLDKQYYNEY